MRYIGTTLSGRLPGSISSGARALCLAATVACGSAQSSPLTDASAADAPGESGLRVEPDGQDAPISDAAPLADATEVPEAGADGSATSGEGGAPCGPGSACPSGLVCGYRVSQGCSATGLCVARPAPLPCLAVCDITLCGCDGSPISFAGCCSPALPSGYAPAPVQAADAGTCG
jgi:hypothetical protein